MSENTRIYNKFEYWSVADCSCAYCLHYSRKDGCKRPECCCADIRQEAMRRELARHKETTPCPV